jgi:dolichol-phosphate mannosyltransferase
MTLIRTTLLIPCYNEVEVIPHLCARLREVIPQMSSNGDVEVLFIDDGSTDGTAEVIRQEATGFSFRVVAHRSNRGLGAALRTGFGECRGSEVVTLDSDCTYDPLQALKLLTALRQGNDVVTGSPYHPRGEVIDVVPWRLFVSKILSYVYWAVLPVRLFTYTSCFRAYRRDVLAHLDAGDDGFLGVTQLLVSAILRGYRVAEIPARLTSRRFGRSKIRTVQVALSHLKYIFIVVGMRLTGKR